MWKTSCRENGDFLPPGDAVHAVDGGDAGLDHLLGVDTALWVDGLAWKSSGGVGAGGESKCLATWPQSLHSTQNDKSFPRTISGVYFSLYFISTKWWTIKTLIFTLIHY